MWVLGSYSCHLGAILTHSAHQPLTPSQGDFLRLIVRLFNREPCDVSDE